MARLHDSISLQGDLFLLNFSREEMSMIFQHYQDQRCVRQVEVYVDKILRYDEQHAADSYSILADQELDSLSSHDAIISKEEFEYAWQIALEKAVNR